MSISIDQIVQLIQSAVQFGTVIMFGAMGEVLTEKSGNLNLGVPGIMYLGGIAGLAASFFYEFNNPAPSGAVWHRTHTAPFSTAAGMNLWPSVAKPTTCVCGWPFS